MRLTAGIKFCHVKIMNSETPFRDNARSFPAIRDALQWHLIAAESGKGFLVPTPFWTTAGKKVRPEEGMVLTRYVEYRNFDR